MNPPQQNNPQPVSGQILGNHIVQMLQARLGPRNLTKSVATTLCLSDSAAYKKIKGLHGFTMPEIAKLARAYDIRVDNLIQKGAGRVVFDFTQLNRTHTEAIDFMRIMKRRLELGLQLEQPVIHFAVTELQILHYVHFPELTAFKLYVMGRNAWNNRNAKPEQRPGDLLECAEIQQLREQVAQAFNRFDSTEFWSRQVLESTLAQIDYYASMDRKERDFYRVVREQVGLLLQHQKEMALCGRKTLPGQPPEADAGKFLMFYNPTIYAVNTFLLESPEFRRVFVVYDNPNTMSSDDPFFCNYTAAWFENLIGHSMRLNHHNPNTVHDFFEILSADLAEFRRRQELLFQL